VEPVQWFFVLSGFLITRNLVVEKHCRGQIRMVRFWWHRALRLVPCHLAALTAVAVLSGAGIISAVTTRHYGLTAAYVSNFVDRAHYSHPVAPTWSLAVEEHFYLLWPVALFLLPIRRLPRVLLATLAVCVTVRLYLTAHEALLAGFFWRRFTVPALDALAVGALLALWARRRDPMIGVRARSGFGPASAAAVCGLYGAPVVLPLHGIAAVPGYYLQLLGMAAALWYLVGNQGGLAVRILEVRPLALLGTISYGVYLWQGVVIGTGPTDQRHAWQQGPWAVIVIIALAAGSWHFLEAPIKRWGRRQPVGLPGREPDRRAAITTLPDRAAPHDARTRQAAESDLVNAPEALTEG
jgi:peptidoglycan/LPS O-acetylase OafA/YrhL